MIAARSSNFKNAFYHGVLSFVITEWVSHATLLLALWHGAHDHNTK